MESDVFDGLFATSQARVLRFLASHVGLSFYEREIVAQTDVSRSAVNLATRALHRAGLLRRERRGRMAFYSVDDRHPLVRQFKILDTIAQLQPLVEALRSLGRRVILFGSCAEGTDTADSDIDLFIVAADRGPVMDVIRQHPLGRPVQPVVVDNQELAVLKERDAAFVAQVQRGIALWEATNELAA